jgi:Ni/Co efflux regulator RcnB
MKETIMRRLILTTLALSFLAVPAAFADTHRPVRHEIRHDMRFAPPDAVVRREHGRIVRKTVVVKPHWKVGKRVPGWQRRAIRDHHRYGLRRPGRGQQWIRVGNDYLLIRITSGAIVRVIVR